MEHRVSSNNSEGFTLIEFCVAVLIMMVGLLGLLQAVNMATIHNLGTLLRNEAITLADDRMVRAKSSVYDATSFTALASDTISSANLVSRGVRSGFANYSVVLTVASAGANTKELTSRVVWRHKGNKQNHTISSIVANPNQ
jgi:type IV pilus assembly protein PilV